MWCFAVVVVVVVVVCRCWRGKQVEPQLREAEWVAAAVITVTLWVGWVGVGVDAITAANDDINYTKNQVSHCQRVRRVHTLDKAIAAG